MKRLAALRECVALLSKVRRTATRQGLHSGSAACLQHQLGQGSDSHWQRWTAMCGAAVGVTCLLQQYDGPARCFSEPVEDEEDFTTPPPERLAQWLASLGAETDAVEIRHSKAVCSATTGCILQASHLYSMNATLHSACSRQMLAWEYLHLLAYKASCMSAGGSGHGTDFQSQMTALCWPPFHYKPQ